MKASVLYNDFKGTAAADISDFIDGANKLQSIGRYFNLDENRFKVIGLSIRGTDSFYISLLCVDKEKSTDNKEHIVSMSCDSDEKKEILDSLFKRLNIVLYDKYDSHYQGLDFDEEVNISDFNQTDKE